MDDWIPLETRTLRENVTDLIRQAIIEGRLASGEELNQAQLAERLGISRGPVREALGRLEQEGLIRNVPYKGVYVTSLSPTYVRELFSLRAVLEGFALDLLIERLRPQDLEALESSVEAMRRAAKAGDNNQLTELDVTFHRSLVELSQHELLRRVWLPLEMGVQRCVHARHQIYESLDEVVGTHPDLVAAIAGRDGDAAERILEEHILEAGEKICEFWPEEVDGDED